MRVELSLGDAAQQGTPYKGGLYISVPMLLLDIFLRIAKHFQQNQIGYCEGPYPPPDVGWKFGPPSRQGHVPKWVHNFLLEGRDGLLNVSTIGRMSISPHHLSFGGDWVWPQRFLLKFRGLLLHYMVSNRAPLKAYVVLACDYQAVPSVQQLTALQQGFHHHVCRRGGRQYVRGWASQQVSQSGSQPIRKSASLQVTTFVQKLAHAPQAPSVFSADDKPRLPIRC